MTDRHFRDTLFVRNWRLGMVETTRYRGAPLLKNFARILMLMVSVVVFTGCTIDADFSADVTEGVAPLTVNFTNRTLPPGNYIWDFGEFTTDDVQFEENPTYTYTTPGVYNVSLTAVVAGPVQLESSIVTKSNYITVRAAEPPPPVPVLTGIYTFTPVSLDTIGGYGFTGTTLVANASAGPVVAGNAQSNIEFKGSIRDVGFIAGLNPAVDTVLWSQVVTDIIEGGPRDINIAAMSPLDDDYVLVGSRGDAIAGLSSGYVYRADSAGNAVWAQSLGDTLSRDGSPTMESLDDVLVRDGADGREIIVVGTSTILNPTLSSEIYLASLATDGTLRWETTLTVPDAFISSAEVELPTLNDGRFIIVATDARTSPRRLFLVLTAPIMDDPDGTHELFSATHQASGLNTTSLISHGGLPSIHVIGQRSPQENETTDLFLATFDEATFNIGSTDLYPEAGFNVLSQDAAFRNSAGARRIAVAGTAFRLGGASEGEPFTYAYMAVIKPDEIERVSSQRFDSTREGSLNAIGYAENGDIIASGGSDGLVLVVRTDSSGALE